MDGIALIAVAIGNLMAEGKSGITFERFLGVPDQGLFDAVNRQKRRPIPRAALSARQRQHHEEQQHGRAVDHETANYRCVMNESHWLSSVLRSIFNRASSNVSGSVFSAACAAR